MRDARSQPTSQGTVDRRTDSPTGRKRPARNVRSRGFSTHNAAETPGNLRSRVLLVASRKSPSNGSCYSAPNTRECRSRSSVIRSLSSGVIDVGRKTTGSKLHNSDTSLTAKCSNIFNRPLRCCQASSQLSASARVRPASGSWSPPACQAATRAHRRFLAIDGIHRGPRNLTLNQKTHQAFGSCMERRLVHAGVRVA